MMDSSQIERLIEAVKNNVHDADRRCEYEVDWLDGDNLVVNCKVTEECDVYVAADGAERLAKAIAKLLNLYYPRVTVNEYWHVHSEANFWGKDASGESFEVEDADEVRVGDVVQYQIYESSYE